MKKGHGVNKDLQEAKKLYQQAAAKGNQQAQQYLEQLTHANS